MMTNEEKEWHGKEKKPQGLHLSHITTKICRLGERWFEFMIKIFTDYVVIRLLHLLYNENNTENIKKKNIISKV